MTPPFLSYVIPSYSIQSNPILSYPIPLPLIPVFYIQPYYNCASLEVLRAVVPSDQSQIYHSCLLQFSDKATTWTSLKTSPQLSPNAAEIPQVSVNSLSYINYSGRPPLRETVGEWQKQ